MDSFSVYIRNPRRICIGIVKKINNILPERLYLQLRYFFELGEWPNLKHPKLFNEKIQWLKLNNRRSEYTTMVDKFAVKKYVADRIGNEYLIPTLGVWNYSNEIDFNALPNSFVLKTTHGGGGGGVVICKDKTKFDKETALIKLNSSMASNPYYEFREWPYKNVSRKIIAEKYMEDDNYNDLIDYKFFCFNGVPRLCQVISDRRTDEKIDFYDMQWKRINGLVGLLVGLNSKIHNSTIELSQPKSFEKMKQIATILSQNIPFSRIDLYDINGYCYFGEITFFPAGGFGYFSPKEWDETIGSWIKLPNN